MVHRPCTCATHSRCHDQRELVLHVQKKLSLRQFSSQSSGTLEPQIHVRLPEPLLWTGKFKVLYRINCTWMRVFLTKLVTNMTLEWPQSSFSPGFQRGPRSTKTWRNGFPQIWKASHHPSIKANPLILACTHAMRCASKHACTKAHAAASYLT